MGHAARDHDGRDTAHAKPPEDRPPGPDGYHAPRPGNVFVIAYFAALAAAQMWTGWTIATDRGE